LTDPHALPALPKCVPVDAVAIAEEGTQSAGEASTIC
jgi:hypothetical protein